MQTQNANKIVKTHFIYTLEEVVKYELLLCFSPFDTTGVSLFSEKEEKDIEMMLEIAYYYYGVNTIDEYIKKHKLEIA